MNRGSNPVALGLVLVGAALMMLSTFLPLNEPTGTFRFVQQNTLIQHDGWILIVAAIAIATGAFRAAYGWGWWGLPLVGSTVAAVGIAWWATNTDMRTLYSVGLDGKINTNAPSVVADHGIAIYVAGVGVALALVGSLMLRQAGNARGTKKQCPDCAETVLADAQACKHCGYRFPAEPDPPAFVDVAPATRRIRCHNCYKVQTVPADARLTTCENCEAIMKIPRKVAENP